MCHCGLRLILDKPYFEIFEGVGERGAEVNRIYVVLL